MQHRLKLRNFIIYLFLFVSLVAIISGCTTPGKISSTSRASANISSKVTNVLAISIVSPRQKGEKFDSADYLELEQWAISHYLEKKLPVSGVRHSTIEIQKIELNPAQKLAQAIATQKPSHLLQLTVPNGTFLSQGGHSLLYKFTVQVELIDPKSRAVIWKYLANVDRGTEAKSDRIADSIIAAMQNDGILQK